MEESVLSKRKLEVYKSWGMVGKYKKFLILNKVKYYKNY